MMMSQCRAGGPPYAQLAHDAPAFSVADVFDKIHLLKINERVVNRAAG